MRNKIFINTIILYIKIVITILISFVSVPIVLRALGAEDYGVYMLVAGVIAMLTFLNNAMSVATQRYLSVTIGERNQERVTDVFTCSVYLHVLIGLIVCVVLEIASLFLFDGFLNINPIRIPAAKIIYQCLIVSTFFTIISVPYDAVLNAKENMFIFSLITIFGSVLRLLFAVSLLYVSADKLILYGVGYAFVSIVEVLLKRLYVSHTYSEMKCLSFCSLDKVLFKEMFAFSGWNTLGSLATVCRNQGVAIVLNLFFGTVINAAYGVANQVNGILANFSSSLQKAISPQLMQSEGAGKREQVLKLTYVSIKLQESIFGILAVPVIIEMETLLGWWLGTVPKYTVAFCRLILLMNIIMLFSAPIGSAIQATGRLKKYTCVTGGLMILHVPIVYLLLNQGLSPISALISMCIVEGIIMVSRFGFGKKIANVSMIYICKRILIPFLSIYLLSFGVGFYLKTLMEPGIIRLVLLFMILILTISICIYGFVFDDSERQKLKSLISKQR